MNENDDNISTSAVTTVISWVSANLTSNEIPNITNDITADNFFFGTFLRLVNARELGNEATVAFERQIMIETMIATVTTEEDDFSDENVQWSDDCEALFNLIK